MTPGARVQAAIEILDAVIASARDNGPPADAIVRQYFRERRYAGSKDRRAVREHVFAAIRHCGDVPATGREAMLGVAQGDEELERLFNGEGHAPAPIEEGEPACGGRLLPHWLEGELHPLVGSDEWPALLTRAPLDLRVNIARTTREAVMHGFPEGAPTTLAPYGIRLDTDTRVDQHPAFRDGLVEVQDEASQLVAHVCDPRDDQLVVDLCAGAGGKALALAALAPESHIVAADISRARLAQLPPRAERAGASNIGTRLLDAPREAEMLADLNDQADIVLIDAPCSGSGTWRRNPEGRWRLTPERLDRLVETQRRLIDMALPLVKPGGKLVYAVCSLLSKEGEEQVANAASRHSGLVWHKNFDFGRMAGAGRLLTPAHDGTDGFFVACGSKS